MQPSRGRNGSRRGHENGVGQVACADISKVVVDPAVTGIVLGSAVLHASWSALAYRFHDQRVGFALLFWVTFVLGIPLVLVTPTPNPASWPFLAGSVLAHVGYVLALIRVNKIADFGQTYPISRGLAPVLVTGVALAGFGGIQDHLTATDLGAIVVIVGGLVLSASTGTRTPGDRGHGRAAVVAAVLVAGLIALYTVLDALGVRHAGTSFGYIAWLVLIQGFCTAAVLTLRAGTIARLRASRDLWALGAVGGVLSVTAYSSVIWAQARGSLAVVAALRETSILFATLISVVAFGERAGVRRLVSAVLVVAGIALLQLQP